MPSLGDELLTNARLVDGGAKVIIIIMVIVNDDDSACQSPALLF